MTRSPYADPVYKANRLAVLEAAGWRCHYCGRPANTADHVPPLAQGGDHWHMVAACLSCNSAGGRRASLGSGRRLGRRSRKW